MLGLFSSPLALNQPVAPESFGQLGWVKSSDAPSPSAAVSFTLSLKQRNIKELKRRALAASTPSAPEYGARTGRF